jgi:hypothetical protein
MRGMGAALVVVLAAGPAWGRERDREPPDRGSVIEAWTGLGSAASVREVEDDFTRDSGLFEFGVTARYRWKWLTFGILGDVGGEFDGPSHVHLAPTAGLSLEILSGMVIDALAEVGGHQVSDIASDYYFFYGDFDEPDPVWLAYGGVRIGLSARFGDEVRVILGGWAILRRDISVERVVVGTDCYSGEGGECPLDVGGAAGVIAFRAGVEL